MITPTIALCMWTAFIFSLSPCARILQRFLYEHVGAPTVASAFLTIGIFSFVFLCSSLRRGRCPVRAYIGLFGAGLVFVFAGVALEKNPEEIFHFFEYGFLSFLFVRALAEAQPSWTVRLSAAFFAAAIGVAEELFQWALPNRVFDLRDLSLNLFAALVVQVALIVGSSRSPKAVSSSDLRQLLLSFLTFTLMLLVCALLTPATVRRIADAIPALTFLEDEPVMDFGYKLSVDTLTAFRSHFSADKLRETDERRGTEVEELLAHRTESRELFLRAHSESRDPFLHEAEVHLFRRDIYLQKLASDPADRSLATIAFGEERILEEFFRKAVLHGLLRGEARARLAEQREVGEPYESPVSGNVFVTISDLALQGFLAGICLLVATMRFALGKRTQ